MNDVGLNFKHCQLCARLLRPCSFCQKGRRRHGDFSINCLRLAGLLIRLLEKVNSFEALAPLANLSLQTSSAPLPPPSFPKTVSVTALSTLSKHVDLPNKYRFFLRALPVVLPPRSYCRLSTDAVAVSGGPHQHKSGAFLRPLDCAV